MTLLLFYNNFLKKRFFDLNATLLPIFLLSVQNIKNRSSYNDTKEVSYSYICLCFLINMAFLNLLFWIHSTNSRKILAKN